MRIFPRIISTRLALVALVLLLVPTAPAHAGPAPCFQSSEAVATVQVRNSATFGVGPSCGPSLACENLAGCVYTVRLDISGYGLLGGVVKGPFEGRVRCGPAPLHCSAVTPDFTVPFGGAPVVCSSAITVAVHVQLICTPTFLG